MADVELAELTQIGGAPVADVEHDGLVDTQPESAPQRGGEVVAGRGKVLACLGDRPAPGGEQRVDLLIRRRNPDLAQRCPGLAIELIDRLLDQDTGRAADRALVAGDHELVEARQRAGLAGPGRHAEPPIRRCWAKNASASAQVASHSGVDSERANSMTIARVPPMWRSVRPAADIASAYWSTSSCSKSWAACAPISAGSTALPPGNATKPISHRLQGKRSCIDATAKPSFEVTLCQFRPVGELNRRHLHKRRSERMDA